MLVWHIGDVIRKAMRDRGWNAKRLAVEANVAEMTVSKAIRREVESKESTLDDIARALDFASWADLALHVPHDPEACGSLVTSAVTLPDDDATRQLAALWRVLSPEDRHIILTVALRLRLGADLDVSHGHADHAPASEIER